MSIGNNLKQIKEQLKEGVTLIAVSKTKPFELVQQAYEAGQMDFGENYVDELVEKAEKLPQVNWHFIGHLQTNKVSHLKKIKNLTIHSVDSYSLAEKLAKNFTNLSVFLQVNVSNEQTKSGFTLEQLKSEFPRIKTLGLNVKGFMCIGEPHQSQRDFALMNQIKQELYPEAQLSMGMSDDWELAQQMGSNYIRVGTAIFGARDYTQKKVEGE